MYWTYGETFNGVSQILRRNPAVLFLDVAHARRIVKDFESLGLERQDIVNMLKKNSARCVLCACAHHEQRCRWLQNVVTKGNTPELLFHTVS